MHTLLPDVEAGNLSEELARRGASPHTRVRVRVEVVGDDAPPMAALAQAGRAFDWLTEEPDLYTDADLVGREAG